MDNKDAPLSREKLRVLRSLDSPKIRRRKNLCIVEGERSLKEALRRRMLLYLVRLDDPDVRDRIVEVELGESDIPCYTLERSLFLEVSGIKAGTGMLGVARIPSRPDPHQLEQLPADSLLLFLDGVQEPGNVGALVRTAWALGAAGVLFGEGTADPFSSKGVRSSAGGVFHLPLYGDIGRQTIEDLAAAGYSVYFADKGGQDYRSISYSKRSILALGNEGAGLSDWVERIGQAVGIPIAKGVDSLNVVVAGGIIASRMLEN